MPSIDDAPTAPPFVHVAYWLTGDVYESAFGGQLDLLSDDERARCARFVHARDRRDYAAAHLLLRRLLSVHGQRDPRDWRFAAGSNGKPLLTPDTDDPPGLSFNLAHARGLVACVVSSGVEVGIDVEPVTSERDVMEIARHLFSPAEVAALGRSGAGTRDATFVELWTLKEAFVKATGDGLGGATTAFTFAFDGETALLFHRADGSPLPGWQFGLFEVGECRLAVGVGTAGVATCRIDGYDGERFWPAPDLRLLRASRGFVRGGA